MFESVFIKLDLFLARKTLSGLLILCEYINIVNVLNLSIYTLSALTIFQSNPTLSSLNVLSKISPCNHGDI